MHRLSRSMTAKGPRLHSPQLRADPILMDDRAGVAVARAKGFAVTGTMGLLDLAARRRLLRPSEAFSRLRAANFRYPPEPMDALLLK